ncbi:MAG TPA: hypoxanthine phosphoribosyltransferase [Saprospiraceae bacterium]|nr:hypoxanthine phosphoribosyltransferase [Saprospiraceae bacterium]
MRTAPDTVQIGKRVFSVFIDEATLRKRVKELGENITRDYHGKTPYFLMILKGSFVFGADLIRAYDGFCETGFIKLSSYEGTSSTGTVKRGQFPSDLAGKDIIIVEDIIDSGLTMNQFIKDLKEQSPNSIAVVSLFVKPEAIQHEVQIDYRGFDIPNAFIIGYGLDLDEKARNLRQIYQLGTQSE